MRRTQVGWSCLRPAAQAAKFHVNVQSALPKNHAHRKRQGAVQDLAGFLSLASSCSPGFR